MKRNPGIATRYTATVGPGGHCEHAHRTFAAAMKCGLAELRWARRLGQPWAKVRDYPDEELVEIRKHTYGRSA